MAVRKRWYQINGYICDFLHFPLDFEMKRENKYICLYAMKECKIAQQYTEVSRGSGWPT